MIPAAERLQKALTRQPNPAATIQARSRLRMPITANKAGTARIARGMRQSSQSERRPPSKVHRGQRHKQDGMERQRHNRDHHSLIIRRFWLGGRSCSTSRSLKVLAWANARHGSRSRSAQGPVRR